ncbi:uncharacterized protein LOC126892403 [Diabrotica virgifera virgifera]|uniref:ISXO2-like transposase domain-containing protein n=1 Tax=Diabrotica virgifera virgifera TaxID=50390 RepID=A0ABM5L624_DIAVI|nr:uncharacterized protein LOC126892403 [Diabrotica virgifera virgifera]
MECESCSIRFVESVLLTAKKEDVLDFFYKHGVMKPTTTCKQCGNILKANAEGKFRCNKLVPRTNKKPKSCRFFLSQRKGTILERCKLPVEKLFVLVSILLQLRPPRFEFVKCELEISSRSMVMWFSFCREVFQDFVISNSVKLGGPDSFVEIHGAKLGKIKFNGDVDSGANKQWFGGYDRNSNNCFLVQVESKDADSLLRIIKDWVLPGTSISSHYWEAYKCLDHEGFRQETMDHSKHFVDPDPDADMYTHNLDRIWREVRTTVPRHGQEYFVDYLAEFYFKRRFSDRFERLHAFFIAAASFCPPAY